MHLWVAGVERSDPPAIRSLGAPCGRSQPPSEIFQRAAGLRLAVLSLLTTAVLAGISATPASADGIPIWTQRLDRAEPESGTRKRAWFSPTLIRIDVSDSGEFDFDKARLREIDGDRTRILTDAIPDNSDRRRGLKELFRSSPVRSWIHGREREPDQSTSLFSSPDDGGVPLLPVGRLSFPNPLNILRNPLGFLTSPLRLLGNPFRWGGRFRGEIGDNFDDLRHLGGNLIVSSGLPVGFDTEFHYRQDDARGHRLNNFWTGDFNVVYRFGKIRNAEIRAGIGINWLSDDSFEIGINSTYGVDIYLSKPWIISTSFDWGTLGSDSLLHMRITAGLDFGRFEIYAGYDFYEIGSRERKTLVAGLGMWF